VCIYGVNPLRIYLHKYAFARFCTEPYEKPSNNNIDNLYMHLTNVAINSGADGYECCDDEDAESGHKRSLGAILKIIKN
jgi:hypothetical protein